MQLDPVVTLAASVYAAPGTFAVLVGSGISRSAQVPTGWDVGVDLIRTVATLTDGTEPADPIAWFREHFSEDPDYSALLEQLAATPADRRNLLHSYFEPTEQEQADGIKVPTSAHRAVADLVARGFVRVIVTTNFDRLMERALRDAGVEPVVVSTPASAMGATPLAHSRCTLVKVHGDYLDPDLKNTVDELGTYDPRLDTLLDRVFDEYGLIVCGWSAEWDQALRAAIARAPSRRYGTYWSHVSPLGERAAQLVAHRGAVEVPITGADEFFDSLAAKVVTLADANRGHPLSTDLAVAELKRYLPDPIHRIKLHDLVMGEVDRASGVHLMDANAPQPTSETISARMREYEGAAATLLPLVATTAFFADRAEHDTLLVDVLRRLTSVQRTLGGFTVWIDLQLYPALLALYAIGLGALARHRVEPLAAVLARIKVSHPNGDQPMVVAVSSWHVGLEPKVCNDLVAPGEKRKTPVSDYLHATLREPLRAVIASDDEYSDTFDQLEYLLGVIGTGNHGDAPIGRFVWRGRHHQTDRPPVIADGYRDTLLAAGLLDGEETKFSEAKASYDDAVGRSGLAW